MEQTITEISLDKLRESDHNPRKTFVDIETLAADIRSLGRVLQPLLVRPHYVNPLQPFGDVHHYEVVFGHRRLRAAQEAGLATVPCMVREMSTAEAMRAQISENLQRADVHPIEEAEGYQQLMQQHGVTADQLAEQTGKSRSYIYGRLTLLKLCPAVREACLRGEVGSETAQMLARLRTEKLQQKALSRIDAKYYKLDDGGKKSTRAIRELLLDEFATELKDAIFDTADGTLLPEAGSCTDCPKRTGNAPEFADVAQGTKEYEFSRTPCGADVCTDVDCWAAKKKAHLEREAKKLAAEGRTVVGGNAAKQAVGADGTVKGAYIALKEVKADLKGVPADQRPEVVLLQDQRTGKTIEAVRRTDAQQAGAKVSAKASQQDLYAAQRKQREEEEKRAREKAERLTNERTELLRTVRDALCNTAVIEEEARAIAACALSGVGYQDKTVLVKLWGEKDPAALTRRTATMSLAEALQLTRDCALVDGVHVHAYNASRPEPARHLMAMAKQLGVDKPKAPTAAKKPAKAAPPKASKAPAKKAAKPAKPAVAPAVETAPETTEEAAA